MLGAVGEELPAAVAQGSAGGALVENRYRLRAQTGIQQLTPVGLVQVEVNLRPDVGVARCATSIRCCF